MRKTTRLAVLLFCIIAFSTCKKNGPSPSPYYISYTFNGTTYNLSNPMTNYNSQVMGISVKNGNVGIVITIFGDNVGSFDIGQLQASIEFSTGSVSEEDYYCRSGTVVITTLNNTKIAGTFSAAADTLLAGVNNPGNTNTIPLPLTNGKFNVNLTQ